MIGEFERPVRWRAAQDRALRRYIQSVVLPYSGRYADVLRRHPIASVADLANLPLTVLEDEGDTGELVLRPTNERIAASGDRMLLARLWWARATRRLTRFNRDELEPAYKPVHWHVVHHARGVLPIGYSAADLDHLAELGRAMLEMAGLRPYDVMIALQRPTPTPAFWQLSLGARRAGISTLFVPEEDAPEQVAQLRPNVIAGSARDLLLLLEGGRTDGLSFAGLHTLLVLGEPVDPMTRARLAEAAGTPSRPAAVVGAWSPPGVRALWSECRDGTDVHTWPASEVLEMVDAASGALQSPGADGEVVYTPLGWRGSVLLRLRTGVFGCLDDSPCVSCGRTSPRIRLVPFLPPFARILDEHPDVALWQAELRTVDGSEELIVFVTPRRTGHPGKMLRSLDRQLSVTQFVVLDGEAMAERLRRHDGGRVVDLRGWEP